MAEAADGFFFDLTHALAGEFEGLADLFEGQAVLYADAEVQAHHLGLALAERAQGCSRVTRRTEWVVRSTMTRELSDSMMKSSISP